MKYLALLLICSTALADDVYIIKKGQASPIDGFVITESKALTIREHEIDLRLTQKTLSLTEQQNALLTEQLSRANTHIDGLGKQLVESRDSSLLSKIGLFLLGAGAAVAITYGVSGALK